MEEKNLEIKNIKINSYGKLKNKEINFEKINIIYGKNESGKSTLLNFIKNIFYGISKNKNGREISDYEKYYPWDGENFSGKIKYKLDNNNIFEIYRDFTKKKPEIYNEQKEEISEKFKIDKKAGSQFFEEQTGIDENVFMSTALTMQSEVKINDAEQGILLQKVANLSESGMEDVSYKKALSTLNSMLLNEVGTTNSKERPINITRENIEKYTFDLKTINEVKQNRFSIEEQIGEVKEKIDIESDRKKLLEKIKEILEKNKIEKEKIKIKNDLLEENKNKIKNLDNEKDNLLNKIKNYSKENIKNDKIKNNKKINILIFVLLIIINIINFVFIKNIIINLIIILFIPIYIVYLFLKTNKTKKIEKIKLNKIQQENNEIEKQMEILDAQINLLEKTNNDIEKEIIEINNNNLKNINYEKNNLIIKNNYKYTEEYINELFNSNIELLLNNNKEKINEYNLLLHKLEINRENINPELEKLLNIEELLSIEKENLNNLEKRAEEYNLTKEILEESYAEMKKNVSPKFNKNLSENIEKISNGKYKNISISDGIMVELDDGRYVPAHNLSIGTIEQIYLSLRLSVMNELSKEKLPIMLDESFAYYDDKRLQAALEFLSKVENQVIIFTCTNREKEMLEEMNIQYNYIEL